MIGIYKITSPTKKVYIGQSVNIEKRFLSYKGYNCKNQNILYNSFLKYGVSKHKFEILEQCDMNQLNDKERYYQDLYSAIGKSGLNCRLTKSSDRSGSISEFHKQKISDSNIGRKKSLDSIEKFKETLNKKYKNGYLNPNKGRKLSEETKKKMSIAKKGIIFSNDTRKKMSLNNTKPTAKIVLDTQTGVFYNSLKEVSILYETKYYNLFLMVGGRKKNNTQFIYA